MSARLFHSGPAKRSPAAPNIPSMAEQGMAGIEVSSWHAMLALRASTPEALATRIRGETASWGELIRATGIKAD